MVAREFQSYNFKRSVGFVNAVDVVDAAEEPKRGTRCSEAGKKEKNSLPASLFSGSCPRCRGRLGGEWRRQKIRCGGGSRYATQWKLMTKMPPPPGRRGQDGACGREPDELELEPWVSLWSNHFGEESTPPLAWTEGNKMPPAPPGRRGTRGIRAIKSTAVEELAPGLGEVAEKS